MEALRLAAIQNEVGVQRNTNAGLELVEFSVVPIPANQDALALAVSKGYLKRGSFVAQEILAIDDTWDMLGDGPRPKFRVLSADKPRFQVR